MLNITESPSIIHHTKIKSGSITIPECTTLNLDGEKTYVTSLVFKVLPQHIQVFSSTLD
jgi:diacylglycerol kinase (ATP)